MSIDNTDFSNRTLAEFVLAAIIIAWNIKNWLLPLGLGIVLILIVKIHLVYNLKIYHEQKWVRILTRLGKEFIGETLMSIIFMYIAFSFGLYTKPLFETIKHYFS